MVVIIRPLDVGRGGVLLSVMEQVAVRPTWESVYGRCCADSAGTTRAVSKMFGTSWEVGGDGICLHDG